MSKTFSRLRSRRPSPATIISVIALIAALSGTAYAALARNSVGTPQLKRDAVVSSKVKDRSLKAVDFRRGQLPRGQRGPRGLQGGRGLQGVPGPTASAFEASSAQDLLVSAIGFADVMIVDNMNVPFAGRLIATGTLELGPDDGVTTAIADCRIEVDGGPVGETVREVFTDAAEVVTVTSAQVVPEGSHDVSIACQSAALSNLTEFEGGNLTVIAAQE